LFPPAISGIRSHTRPLYRTSRSTEQQAIDKLLLLLREVKEQVQEIEERLRKVERFPHRLEHSRKTRGR
jgi:hypothetical protein